MNKLWLLFGCIIILNFMSAEAERNYTFVIHGFEVDDRCLTCDGVLDKIDLKVKKIAKNVVAINGSADLLVDLPPTCQVSVLGFQKDDETKLYSEVHSFSFSSDLCVFLRNDTLLVPDLLKATNIPDDCPINKKQYVFNKYVIDEEKLPESVFGHFWKFQVTVSCDGMKKFSNAVIIEIVFKKDGGKNGGKGGKGGKGGGGGKSGQNGGGGKPGKGGPPQSGKNKNGPPKNPKGG